MKGINLDPMTRERAQRTEDLVPDVLVSPRTSRYSNNRIEFLEYLEVHGESHCIKTVQMLRICNEGMAEHKKMQGCEKTSGLASSPIENPCTCHHMCTVVVMSDPDTEMIMSSTVYICFGNRRSSRVSPKQTTV